MKRSRLSGSTSLQWVLAICFSLLFSVGGSSLRAEEQPVHANAAATEAVHAPAEAAGAHGGGEEEKPSTVIMHHVMDSKNFEFEPFGHVELPQLAIPESVPVLGGLDISVTKRVVMLWIVAAAVVVVFTIVGGRYRKLSATKAPSGMMNTMESLVEFIRTDVAKANIGHGYERYTPFLLSIFMFILFCNLFGLIPYASTATGDISVTMTLAIFSFFIIQIAAIKELGLVGFLKHLTVGTHWALWIIMVPIEVIGLFTKPFALTVRLFANMTAGHIVILSLIFITFIMKSFVTAAVISVPFATFIYLLELFVAFLQAFIFTMLTSLFIGLATAHEGGHDEHGTAAAHH